MAKLTSNSIDKSKWANYSKSNVLMFQCHVSLKKLVRVGTVSSFKTPTQWKQLPTERIHFKNRIRWPEKIRNEELWERTGQEPVKSVIEAEGSGHGLDTC